MEDAFITACKNGKLMKAQDIYNTYKPNIHADNDKAFRSVCKNGHKEVAQWLMTLDDKPNIHVFDDQAFRVACLNGNLEVARWLMTLDDKPDIHALDDIAFRYACYNGHIETAQWLMTLEDKPNIRAENDFAFIYANKRGHIEIVKWLITICDDYYIEIKYNKIKSYKIIKYSLQELYNKKEYDKIIDKLKIERKDIMLNKEDKCSICFTEDYNFISSCNHCYCLDCFLIWKINYEKNSCCYCKQKIITEKCILRI